MSVLIAVDLVDVLFERKKGVRALISPFPFTYVPEAEDVFLALSEQYNIALLANVTKAQRKKMLEIMLPLNNTYVILCNDAEDFRMFADAYTPLLIFSNLPNRFECAPCGAIPYADRWGLFREMQNHVSVKRTEKKG